MKPSDHTSYRPAWNKTDGLRRTEPPWELTDKRVLLGFGYGDSK